MAPEELLVKRMLYAGLAALIVLPILLWTVTQYNWEPQPQPIKFNHELHAGKRQIQCTYCHRGAEKGYYAGVPSVQDCNNCHQNLLLLYPKDDKDPSKTKDPANQQWFDEFSKLKGYVDNKREIRWFKYYDMPEHVKFAHKAHLDAGVKCDQCHGNVAQMPVIQMKEHPTMGWCITCHRDKNAPTDCTACHR